MKKVHQLLITSFILFLTGCASSPVSLEKLKEKNIESVTLASEKSLNFETSSNVTTGAVIGGIIGAAVSVGVDANINAGRKKRFTPIAKLLQDQDFRAIFAEELAALSGDVFAENLQVNVTDTLLKKEEFEKNSLNLLSTYQLSPNHQTVTVKVTSTLKSGDKGKTHTKKFTNSSSVDLGGVKVKTADTTQYWLDNREELLTTIKKTMHKVVQDIQTFYNTDQSKK